ncbi:hypothetical protein [Flavobacterium olei]|uniref:hypothetical protein n=1 Tax=Flavobacterium olei TaxID=1886782 RepID=UPI003219A1B1
MATSRINIGNKFKNADIPSENDFEEIFDSFVHKDEDKANFQMVETGTDNEHYVTPALLRTGLQNIGIITGNSYMPVKEHFDSFIGSTLPLEKLPVKFSVQAFKNGQLLLEKENPGDEGDYTINYDTAVITFSSNIDNRNIEVDYWYKNLTPNPGGGSGQQIDFGSFLHTSGNETKNGILTFNNTTPTSTSGIVLTNSGADANAKVLDVTVTGAGSGVSVQNTAAGTGIKLSNTGTGVGISLNSTATASGDLLQVSKDNVVKAKIDKDGNVTAAKFVTSGGTEDKFVKGDGSLDPKTYAEDTKVIHTTGNESKDGALNLTHNDAVQDVLTITKNNSANCLKLVQNSSSNATTSTFDTGSEDVNRKAISIQKITVEKAFITHDGNVSGTSFTTLNEKADITDGFLTLANSASPAAMTDHAKLYAKKDGANTDMYVMGSDGVEKKIGASGDLSNVLHKTGYATETKTGELVIDSGINGDSGFMLSKLPTFINSAPHSTGLDNDYNLCRLPNGDLLTQSSRAPYNVSISPSGGGTPSSYNVTSYSSTAYMKSFPNGDVLLSNSNGTNVEKIPFGGGSKVVYSNERKYDDIVILANGDFLGVFNTNVYKVPFGGGASTIFATGFIALRSITELPNGDIIVADGYNDNMTLYKIPPGGGSKTVYLSGNYSFRRLLSFSNGDILFHYLNVVYKVPFGGGSPIIYASGFEYSITGLIILNSNEILVGQLYSIVKVSGSISKNVLTTDSAGKVIKTTYLEDVQYVKSSELNNYIDKTSNQTITGIKTFNSSSTDLGMISMTSTRGSIPLIKLANSGLGSTCINSIQNDTVGRNLVLTAGPESTGFAIESVNNGLSTFSLNKEGNVTANSYIKKNGTSIQYLMADGSVTTSSPQALPYKVYTAILTQTSTNDPVANVLENTLGGTVVWTRTGIGNYLGTLANAFTMSKTIAFITLGGSVSSQPHNIACFANSSNTVLIQAARAGVNSDSDMAPASIEIRVYN